MWLLNAHTGCLEEFFGDKTKPYAILSHTWEDEEISFRDLQNGKYAGKKGYEKIQKTCALAIEHGLDYAWVDTCCIDKSSSAELSEAINSMFRWYQRSEVCFVFSSRPW